MRLGILGGTFDPVHQGHLTLATTAQEQLSLDWVSFVPAGQPWRKANRTVAPAEHRVQMLQLATAHAATFDVVTVEVERLSPTYTVDTLEWFRQQQAAAELFFILGQDALADLPAWQHSEHILALASLAVAPRLPGQRSVERLAAVLPGPAERVISLLMPQMEISASEIRKRVKAGLQIRHLVPEGVERYIREKGLYR